MRKYWVVWLTLLVISAYIVPYSFIGDINRITASFLYWVLFALAAIISIFKILRYWRD